MATPADLDAITETISLAFHDDPTWSWAFPDADRRQEQYRVWWHFLINGALRFDSPPVFMTEGAEAAAIWLPPGAGELSLEDEARVPGLLSDLVGDHADDVLELIARFEDAQPPQPPHYYLSLLGVHDDHRGEGIGMALLADNLSRFDDEAAPSYLESSNAANNPRYEQLGYRQIGEFTTPDDAVAITAYWRDSA